MSQTDAAEAIRPEDRLPDPIITFGPIRRAVTEWLSLLMAGLCGFYGLRVLRDMTGGMAGDISPDRWWAGVFLLVVFAGIIIFCLMTWRALRNNPMAGLRLTTAGITDDQGRLLIPLAAIAGVETGVLSMKPRNGFHLVLGQPVPNLWVPGLIWIRWNRAGIGGATSRVEGRIMADRLRFMLHELHSDRSVVQ